MIKHREQIKLITKAAKAAGHTVKKLGSADNTMLGDVIRVSNNDNFWLVSTRKIGFFPNTKTWFKQLCNSKETSSKLLKQLGYKTVASHYVGEQCFLDQKYYEQLISKITSYPVVYKPENGVRGRGIAVVTTQKQLNKFYTQAKKNLAPFLIQPVVTGSEYRIAVFEGEVFFVHNKNFYVITGNGVDSISALCKKRKNPVDKNYMSYVMAERGYTLKTILPEGETVPVKVVKNDGNKILVGDAIPQEMTTWAKKLCSKIGCTTVGIDVVVPEDFGQVDKYQIFEINASPAFAYIEKYYPNTRKLVDTIASHIVKKSFS